MAGYRRPPSRTESRQIRRQRRRIFFGSALVVSFALAVFVGLLYLIHHAKP
jgi:hypothetical protein